MPDERAELLERIGVEQDVQPLSGRKLAFFMLTFDARFAASQASLCAALLEVGESSVAVVHQVD
jgi:hypothetical protein